MTGDVLLRKKRDLNKKLLEVKAETASIQERVEDVYDQMSKDEFRRARDKSRYLRSETLKLEQDICDINCELDILKWQSNEA